MTGSTTTGSTGLRATEVVNSLTGFDEAKVEQYFGAPVELLSGAKFMRALLFGYFLHQGVEAKAAHKQVMGLTQSAVSDYFADEEDDADGDDPGSTPPPPGAEAPTDELGHADPAPPAHDVRDPEVADPAGLVGSPGFPPGPSVASGGLELPRRPIADSPQA